MSNGIGIDTAALFNAALNDDEYSRRFEVVNGDPAASPDVDYAWCDRFDLDFEAPDGDDSEENGDA